MALAENLILSCMGQEARCVAVNQASFKTRLAEGVVERTLGPWSACHRAPHRIADQSAKAVQRSLRRALAAAVLKVAPPRGAAARRQGLPAPASRDAQEQEGQTHKQAGLDGRCRRREPLAEGAGGVHGILLGEDLRHGLQQHLAQILAEREPVQRLPVLGGLLQLRDGTCPRGGRGGPRKPQLDVHAAEGQRRLLQHCQLFLSEATLAQHCGPIVHHGHDEVREGLLGVLV
mmetsp:Transcript_91123/g.221250  ORF Transcript_91123/g.221250 Transcript_91123/m.221250 type:complete len:232 (-) Transcript_91123:1004-1699(-)